MTTLPNFSDSTLRAFHIPGSKEKEKESQHQGADKPAQEGGGGGQKQPGDKEKGNDKDKQQQAGGRAIDPDKIASLTTNYSVAPGMAWIEFTNIAPVSAGDIKGDVPLWGSGQLLAQLKLPIACVVIKPTITPALLAAQQSEAQKKQQQKQQQQQQKDKDKEKEKEQKDKEQKSGGEARVGAEVPEAEVLRNAQMAGMGVETQARHAVDDELRDEYRGAIFDEIDSINQDQPRLLTPEEQALTGMSPQGFPGLLPGLRSASALPSGMGVQGATIDNSAVPAEITIKLVGSGQVPANSRWLVFTVTGV